MLWIQSERAMTWADAVVVYLAFFLGGIGVWCDTWFSGVAVWVGGSIAWYIGTEIVFSLRLPNGVREAISLAVAEFHERYPSDKIVNVAVRAVEPERFIISIWYEGKQVSRPTARRYFGVSRTSSPVVEELSKRDWWPRGLK